MQEVPHYKLSLQFQDIGNTLKNLCFKNTLEFCKFRPAYGMFLLTGLVFLFAFYAALTKIKEWSVKDDFYCVALELTFSMVMLISVVYFIANSGFYTAAKDYDLYTPFEQFVHVSILLINCTEINSMQFGYTLMVKSNIIFLGYFVTDSYEKK